MLKFNGIISQRSRKISNSWLWRWSEGRAKGSCSVFVTYFSINSRSCKPDHNKWSKHDDRICRVLDRARYRGSREAYQRSYGR